MSFPDFIDESDCQIWKRLEQIMSRKHLRNLSKHQRHRDAWISRELLKAAIIRFLKHFSIVYENSSSCSGNKLEQYHVIDILDLGWIVEQSWLSHGLASSVFYSSVYGLSTCIHKFALYV